MFCSAEAVGSIDSLPSSGTMRFQLVVSEVAHVAEQHARLALLLQGALLPDADAAVDGGVGRA